MGENFENSKETLKESFNTLKEDVKKVLKEFGEVSSDFFLEKFNNLFKPLGDLLESFQDTPNITYSDNFSSVKEKLSLSNFIDFLSQNVELSQINNDLIFHFIKKLPKVDLHCHIGGCARISDIVEIAKTYPRKSDLRNNIENFFASHDSGEINRLFRKNPKLIVREIFPSKNYENIKAIHYANIIQYVFENNELELLDSLYHYEHSGEIIKLIDKNIPTKKFSNIGLEKYLKLGDWAGSTLLQTEKAIKKAIDCLYLFIKEHNVKYLELRFNPKSYTREGLSLESVYNYIIESLSKFKDDILVNIIFIASKPKGKSEQALDIFKLNLQELVILIKKINAMEKINEHKLEPRLVGLDIAGIEYFFHKHIQTGSEDIISATRNIIYDLFKTKIFITIHCGETGIDRTLSKIKIISKHDSFINAVMDLGAERLGHALNISGSFIHKLKIRKTTLELCPSSNCQTNYFSQTPWIDKSEKVVEYPLLKYLNWGLKVTVNTDDPAISKTDWTNELFIASALCSKPLSIEQIIRLVYNGVRGAFLLGNEKEELERVFNREIMDLLNYYTNEFIKEKIRQDEIKDLG